VARPCASCNHPNRAELDLALATRSITLVDVSRRFGISLPALRRHRQHSSLLKDLAQPSLLARAREISTSTRKLAQAAISRGNVTQALSSLRASARALELEHQIEAAQTTQHARGLDARGFDTDPRARLLRKLGVTDTTTPPPSGPLSPQVREEIERTKRILRGQPSDAAPSARSALLRQEEGEDG
jgi:hypothetical protein